MGERQRGKDKGKKKAKVETVETVIAGVVTKGGAKAIKAGKLTSTIIKLCPAKCRHEYQDSRYGPGMRVFNPARKGTMCACTVCGRETGL